MRIVALFCISAALALAGCARNKAKDSSPSEGFRGGHIAPASAGNSKLIVTPDHTLVGKVALVNQSARFVVLNFPIGRLPAKEQPFNLYRGGLKVGEVKATAMQHDNNVVADLVAGESQVGDEARAD